MPKIAYIAKDFSQGSLDVIDRANLICDEYAAQGYELTLRQLYYQFVSRGWLANKQTEYKRLGDIINNARLAGLIDWDYIVDRTRNLQSLAHWDNPRQIISAVAQQYRHDRWASQPVRVEVWIEKDALAGVIAGPCDRNDVPYFSCRGYTSQSELWGAAQRLISYEQREKDPQQTLVIHLGDHDPSGIDMTRDITARLRLFGAKTRVKRIALNMDQVEQYDPPPNPAKLTDSRSAGYLDEHGDMSWELDALDPATLDALVEDEILTWRDERLWALATRDQEYQRGLPTAVRRRWTEVQTFLDAQ